MSSEETPETPWTPENDPGPRKCPGCGQTVTQRSPGRPTDLSPDLAADIESMLAEGWSKVGMCRYLGIAESTFFRWQQKARQGEEPYATLLLPAARAEELRVRKLEMQVENGTNIKGDPDWHAAAEVLKARRPDEWSKRVRIEQVEQEISMAFIELIERRRPHLRDEFVLMLIEEEEGAEVPALGPGEDGHG